MKVLYLEHRTEDSILKIYAKGKKRFEIKTDLNGKIHYCKIWKYVFPVVSGKFFPSFPFLPDELKALRPEIDKRTQALAVELVEASGAIRKLSSCKPFFLHLQNNKGLTPSGIAIAYNSLKSEKVNFQDQVKISKEELESKIAGCFEFGEEIDLSFDMVERLCSQVAFEPSATEESIAWKIIEQEQYLKEVENSPVKMQFLNPGEYWKELGISGEVIAVFSSSAKSSTVKNIPSFTFGMQPRMKTSEGTPFKKLMIYQDKYLRTDAKEFGSHTEAMIQAGIEFFFS